MKIRRVVWIAVLISAVSVAYWLGYECGRSSAEAKLPRMFVSDSFPWTVNTWSASFTASGTLRSTEMQNELPVPVTEESRASGVLLSAEVQNESRAKLLQRPRR